MEKSKARRFRFTDLSIKRLKLPQHGQVLYWDTERQGLQLLVGKRGKSFRAYVKLAYGKWCSVAIGNFGTHSPDINVKEAEIRANRIKDNAYRGEDPRKRTRQAEAAEASNGAQENDIC